MKNQDVSWEDSYGWGGKETDKRLRMNPSGRHCGTPDRTLPGARAHKDSDPAAPSWTSYTKQETRLFRSIY